ncbi:hypothetical protein [Acaryochloris sp. IP29b_bin.137]|uniref:hypothetical protein n=1 Tax=Acaryochloris sp. IP29b_bin.137 TaxID=2969217 RepID=UPI00262607FE|nr:hypothetical protein [Acaryochloris sp. IP29b_bin.137]
MKWILISISIALLVGAIIAAPVYAQGMPKSSPGHHLTSQRPRDFNPDTVETISGKIVRVDQVASQGRRSGKGVHLSVETSDETVDVHLGPSWYLDEQQFNLKSGDPVEVTGSKVTDASSPTLIAAKVKSGDTNIDLRDENGMPAWRGMGRGKGMGRNRGNGRSPWRAAQ